MAIKPQFVSPRTAAVFPKVVGEPDMYDGKKFWKISQRISPSEAAEISTKIDEAIAAFKAEITADVNIKPVDKKKILGFQVRSPVKKELNRETAEETGLYLVTFKSNYEYKDRKTQELKVSRVLFFDAKGTPFVPKTFWGGSECKVAYNITVRANGSAERLDVRLNIVGIKVFKLVQAGSGQGASSMGFGDAEEGYEAPPEAPQSAADDLDGPIGDPPSEGEAKKGPNF